MLAGDGQGNLSYFAFQLSTNDFNDEKTPQSLATQTMHGSVSVPRQWAEGHPNAENMGILEILDFKGVSPNEAQPLVASIDIAGEIKLWNVNM